MADSGKKSHILDAARDGASPDVPQTRATRTTTLTTSLQGLVGLIALVCSLSIITPRHRPVPFSEPRSEAVDHVNP